MANVNIVNIILLYYYAIIRDAGAGIGAHTKRANFKKTMLTM